MLILINLFAIRVEFSIGYVHLSSLGTVHLSVWGPNQRTHW